MNRILLVSLTILATFYSFTFAADTYRTPRDVISKEGQLRVTDGSSIYTFKEGGAFELTPIDESGRCINGTWSTRKEDDRTMEIEGLWVWRNGLSVPNDSRRMVLMIFPLSGEKETVGYAKTEVYKCYFVIDELTKRTIEPVVPANEAQGVTVRTSPDALLSVIRRRPDSVKGVVLGIRASSVVLKDGICLLTESIEGQKEMAETSKKAGFTAVWE